MKDKDQSEIQALLRERGYRATPGKVAILEVLKDASHPLTTAEILAALEDKKDETTLYRSLDAFVDTGILRKVNFNDRSARYEWNIGTHHHHHIVCENCGRIEDVDICDTDLDASVLKRSKEFREIMSHSVEFFGFCKSCAKK